MGMSVHGDCLVIRNIINMKLVVLFLACLTVAYGQIVTPACTCGYFVTVGDLEEEVKHLPKIETADCDDLDACVSACSKESNTFSGNMELDHELDNGYTFGQDLCISAMTRFHPFLHKEKVYTYANLCNGPWKWTGDQSDGELCCNMGHQHAC